MLFALCGQAMEIESDDILEDSLGEKIEISEEAWQRLAPYYAYYGSRVVILKKNGQFSWVEALPKPEKPTATILQVRISNKVEGERSYAYVREEFLKFPNFDSVRVNKNN